VLAGQFIHRATAPRTLVVPGSLPDDVIRRRTTISALIGETSGALSAPVGRAVAV
jgi:hypothetical protein